LNKKHNIKEFWDSQTTSRHRSDSKIFYKEKALEHSSYFTEEERTMSCIDIGCGAGELLYYLDKIINLNAATDYSSSMLLKAKKRLVESNIEFIDSDIGEILEHLKQKIWITTGAINQYLDKDELGEVVDSFKKNNHASGLFLFDCVDPYRYFVWALGSSYSGEMATRPTTKPVLLARKLKACYRILRYGSEFSEFSEDGMGYGMCPSYWLRLCDDATQVEIFSSKYYEYRYHVFIRKISVTI